MSRRPRVHTRCVANGYSQADERIIEFGANVPDGTLADGLISFRNCNGVLNVEIYSTGGPVRIRNEEAILRELDDVLGLAQRMINDMVADGRYAEDYINDILALRDRRRTLDRA